MPPSTARRQTDEIPPDVAVISGTITAGHYSRPLNDTPCEIRYRARLSAIGPHPAQRAYISAQCLTPCHQTRDIGDDLNLGDLIRWYAQHARKAAVVLELASILKAIGDDGQDI